jgi:elongation factor 1-gamma
MAPSNNGYQLHVPESSFRGFATLIAAEYNGITIQVNTTDVATVAATKSPIGKLPLLETPNGAIIFSSHAASRYIASIRHDIGLLGSSLIEQTMIDAWMDWCTTDVELPACVWFYPVVGYMKFHPDAYVPKGKKSSKQTKN